MQTDRILVQVCGRVRTGTLPPRAAHTCTGVLAPFPLGGALAARCRMKMSACIF